MKKNLLFTCFTLLSAVVTAQNVGIGTATPSHRLDVVGDVSLTGSLRLDGVQAIFNEGNDVYGNIRVLQNNSASFQDGMYINLNSSGGSNADIRFFANGNIERMRISAASGNVGIGLAPSNTFGHSRLVVSRDGAAPCCGGEDATLGLAESLSSGRRPSISFHSSGESEGEFELTQAATTGVGVPNIFSFLSNRRLRFFDHQGQGLGLELSGNLWFGNGNSRTQTRDNAGLRGDQGAQSGFFETSSPTNYYAGAGSWQHLIDVRHSNNGNNYALQIAGSFFDQRLYFRKTNDNPSQAWSEIQTFGSANPSNIAFFAYKNANQFQSHNTWAEQNFGATTFNDGGAYDPGTGNFTVPAGQGGVYSFQTTIFSYDWTDRNPRALVSIYVNGGERARLDDQNFRDMFKWQSINGAVTLKLNAGDVVDVRTYYTRSDGNGVTWNTEGTYMSFFSGHRVF